MKRGELPDGTSDEVRRFISELKIESRKQAVLGLVVSALQAHDLLDASSSETARSLLESDTAIDKRLREAG